MPDVTAPTTTAVLPVTDAAFAEDVLRRPGAVLVEFTAEWCGPCRMMAPVLAQIAVERAGTLAVRTLDVDANPATSRAHGVLGMPTMILFRDGRPVLQVTGARSRQRLLDELDRALAGQRGVLPGQTRPRAPPVNDQAATSTEPTVSTIAPGTCTSSGPWLPT